MRDINRIDDVLKRLGDVWKRSPDLRLGQLITNIASDPILYYVEDEELISEIERFYGSAQYR